MVPADQRLQPDDLSRCEFHLRLVVQFEFVALDRQVQVGGDHHPLAQLHAPQRGALFLPQQDPTLQAVLAVPIPIDALAQPVVVEYPCNKLNIFRSFFRFAFRSFVQLPFGVMIELIVPALGLSG